MEASAQGRAYAPSYPPYPQAQPRPDYYGGGEGYQGGYPGTQQQQHVAQHPYVNHSHHQPLQAYPASYPDQAPAQQHPLPADASTPPAPASSSSPAYPSHQAPFAAPPPPRSPYPQHEAPYHPPQAGAQLPQPHYAANGWPYPYPGGGGGPNEYVHAQAHPHTHDQQPVASYQHHE